MRTLSFNFLLYTIGGMWRPVEWSSPCSKLLYGVYSFVPVYLMAFLTLVQFLDIVIVIDNVEDFAANSLISISVISVVCKILIVLTRRGRIVNLLQILQEEPCKPCNEEENNIQTKFDRLIRSYSIAYTLLASVSATGGTAGALLDVSRGRLPYNAWVPYRTMPFVFWFTSLQEMAALIYGTIINVATETAVLGFCLQTCAQLEILKHRLQNVPKINKKAETPENPVSGTAKKTSVLSEHICHHLQIIRFAQMINDVYSEVFFVQFFVSILVLCSSVYHLTSRMAMEDFATLIVYTFSMFVQILVYCWAGNEVMIKSAGLSEAVYHMDWILMTISDRKDLLMIMKRSARPIRFTSSFLVTMSLDSYGNLLKASYSAFNVLQQS